jgi:hypothetical protein
MKNLKTKKFAITALALGFFAGTAFGQVPQTQQQGSQQDHQYQQQQTSPQGQNQRSHPDRGVNYTNEVQESDLPQAVTSSLEELYPVHEISEVHRGDDNSFRVKVENRNDRAYVYYNSQGNFLRARNAKDFPEGTFSSQGSASPQQQSQRTQDQGTMGTGTQDRTGTGTQGTMGTGTQDRTGTGTGTGTWGTDDTDRGTGTQGTMGTGTQDRTGTGTGTQGTMGTGTQDRTGTGTGTGTWGTDDTDRGTGTQGTMGTGTQDRTGTGTGTGTWGTDDTDRGTGTQGTGTQGTMGTGTQDRTGTGTGTGTWGTDDTDRGTGTQDTARWGRDYDDSGTGTHYDRGTDQGTTGTFDQGSTGTGTQGTTGTGTMGTDDRTGTQGQTGAFPQEQSQRGSLDDVDYDDEIEENELPETVTSSLRELYPAHEISKAYRGNDNSYKVKVENNDDKASVYFNSNGEFVKAETGDEDSNRNRGGLFNRNRDRNND